MIELSSRKMSRIAIVLEQLMISFSQEVWTLRSTPNHHKALLRCFNRALKGLLLVQQIRVSRRFLSNGPIHGLGWVTQSFKALSHSDGNSEVNLSRNVENSE